MNKWLRGYCGVSSLLTLIRPSSAETPLTRSHDRYRRAGLTAFASLISLGANGLVGLLSVPLVVGYLGKDLYGVWLTLSSTLSWISLANLGAPQGLQNALASALARDDSKAARILVSTALAGAGLLAVILLVLATAAGYVVNWVRVFNLPHHSADHDVISAICLSLLLTALNVPLNSFRVVYLAHQHGYLASGFDAARLTVSLVFLFIAIHVRAGMDGIVLAMYGTTLFVTIFSLIWMFWRRYPELRPSFHLIQFRSLRVIAKTSTSVFGIAVIVMLISTAGNFILTQTAGPAEVPAFALPAMVFALARGIGASVSGSPGPAYTEAAARGEWQWIRTARRRIRRVVGSVMALFVIGMVIAGPWMIDVWSRGEVHTSRILIFLLGLHSALWITFGGESTIINNVDMAHRLVTPALLEAVLFVGGAIALAPGYGGVGIAAAMLVAFTCTNGWYVPRQVSIAIDQGIRKSERRVTAIAGQNA